jgi:putative DNA primase/helicase
VKAFTGNDAIKARFLYQEHFTFRPAAKLWLVANHQPKINDDDDAIWRRILLVPFTRTVAKEKRDPRIKAHLRDVSKSGAAILAWMVKGCLAWQRDGLRVPQIVDDATEDYRLSQDPIRDFIEQCCVLNPSVWVTIGALRQEYEKFCKERGGNPATPNDFAARLKARGCTIDRRHAGRGWLGVGLLE